MIPQFVIDMEFPFIGNVRCTGAPVLDSPPPLVQLNHPSGQAPECSTVDGVGIVGPVGETDCRRVFLGDLARGINLKLNHFTKLAKYPTG